MPTPTLNGEPIVGEQALHLFAIVDQQDLEITEIRTLAEGLISENTRLREALGATSARLMTEVATARGFQHQARDAEQKLAARLEHETFQIKSEQCRSADDCPGR